jgi:4'-phosphopantetheinyl transferase
MIHWLLQSLDSSPEIAGGVAPAGMLCDVEQQRLSTLKVEKRRRDWLLGRWTAKHLVQGYLAQSAGAVPLLDEIQIANADDGSPYCLLRGGNESANEPAGEPLRRLPVSLAVSHSHGYAFCALCHETEIDVNPLAPADAAGQNPTGARWSLGCDIEWIEHREQSFVSDFFTAQEIRDVMGTPVEHRDCRVTAIWSAKESVLKSLRTGLRIDTRRIECRFALDDWLPREWSPLTVMIDAGLVEQFPGAWYAWWQVQEGFVLTMALHEAGSPGQADGGT